MGNADELRDLSTEQRGINMTFFQVVEKFVSINGEGLFSGYPAIFIRLAGCNLKCSYCDSTYANNFDAGSVEGLADLLEYCRSVRKEQGINRITVTGGEPLRLKTGEDLIDALVRSGFMVEVETNGSIPLKPLLDRVGLFAPLLTITMDYKLPSSEMELRMDLDNLGILRPEDVLKFVIGDEEDLEVTHEILKDHQDEIRATIFLSPVYPANKIGPGIVGSLISMENEFPQYRGRLRTQLQIHKYIWAPDKQGV